MKFLVVIFALVVAASAGTTFSRGFKIGGIHRLGVDDLFFITRLKLVINILTFQSAGWPVFGPGPKFFNQEQVFLQQLSACDCAAGTHS